MEFLVIVFLKTSYVFKSPPFFSPSVFSFNFRILFLVRFQLSLAAALEIPGCVNLYLDNNSLQRTLLLVQYYDFRSLGWFPLLLQYFQTHVSEWFDMILKFPESLGSSHCEVTCTGRQGIPSLIATVSLWFPSAKYAFPFFWLNVSTSEESMPNLRTYRLICSSLAPPSSTFGIIKQSNSQNGHNSSVATIWNGSLELKLLAR